jgi:endo-1,4-beta-xylanase
MLKVAACVTALAVAFPFAAGAPASAAAAPASTSTAKLNILAHHHGKLYFGSATDNPDLSNSSYVAIFNDTTTFGQTTAANAMKWVRPDQPAYYDYLVLRFVPQDATEPEQGQFTFAAGDQIANLAKQTRKLLRGKIR